MVLGSLRGLLQLFRSELRAPSSTSIVELPLLVLYAAVMTAKGRGLHEALLALSSPPIASIARYLAWLSNEYRRLVALHVDIVLALRRLAERASSNIVARFLRGYVSVMLSRGDAMNFIERWLERSIDILKTHVRGRVETVGVVMEATVLILAIVVFTLTLASASIGVAYAAAFTSVLAVTATAIILRLKIIDIYVKRPTRAEAIATIAAYVASLLILVAPPLPLLAVASTLASLMAVANIKSYVSFTRSISAFQPVFAALELGIETTLQPSLLPREAIYVLRTGRPRQAYSNPTSTLLALMLAETVTAGARAARASSMVLGFLEALIDHVKMVLRYSILYEIAAVASYIILTIAYTAMASLATGGELLGLGLTVADPELVSRILLFTTSSAILTTSYLVWGNGGAVSLLALLAVELVKNKWSLTISFPLPMA